MARETRAGGENFWVGWLGALVPVLFRREIQPTALYNDSSHFIANDSAADVRALVARDMGTAGVGNHRGIRLTPIGAPLLVTWIGVGGSGADTIRFRIALVTDRPTEAGQDAMTSSFSQGAISALLVQTSVATANLPTAAERLWEATTQSGPTVMPSGFKYGMCIVPIGSEFSMWSTTADEASSDYGLSWREFPNL